MHCFPQGVGKLGGPLPSSPPPPLPPPLPPLHPTLQFNATHTHAHTHTGAPAERGLPVLGSQLDVWEEQCVLEDEEMTIMMLTGEGGDGGEREWRERREVVFL